MKYSVCKIEEYPLDLILKQKKLSMRKFAELAGIEYTHIWRLNKGTYIATEKTMQKIVAAVASLSTPTETI